MPIIFEREHAGMPIIENNNKAADTHFTPMTKTIKHHLYSPKLKLTIDGEIHAILLSIWFEWLV